MRTVQTLADALIDPSLRRANSYIVSTLFLTILVVSESVVMIQLRSYDSE